MGYSGRIVVARAGERLAATEAFAGAEILAEKTYADGWQSALAWSAEAGLQASRAALVAALEAHNTFAEETFDELLAALGLTIESSEPA